MISGLLSELSRCDDFLIVSCPVALKAEESVECLSLLKLMPNRTGWPGFGCPSKMVLGAVSKGMSCVGGLFCGEVAEEEEEEEEERRRRR